MRENMPGVYKIAVVVKIKDSQEKIDYSEAAYVDSQHEGLQKHKFEGITLEELQHRHARLR